MNDYAHITTNPADDAYPIVGHLDAVPADEHDGPFRDLLRAPTDAERAEDAASRAEHARIMAEDEAPRLSEDPRDG